MQYYSLRSTEAQCKTVLMVQFMVSLPGKTTDFRMQWIIQTYINFKQKSDDL
jgi:hypothetical protein